MENPLKSHASAEYIFQTRLIMPCTEGISAHMHCVWSTRRWVLHSAPQLAVVPSRVACKLTPCKHNPRYTSGTDAADEANPGDLTRPDFPPEGVHFIPAFAPEVSEALGSDVLMAWAFLRDFGGEVLGLWPISLDELLQALAAGPDSRLVGEVHVALLRVIQVRLPSPSLMI